MPCAKQYNAFEVNDILQQSEGRLSPVSNQPGHALHLHVDARGEQLSDRFLRTSNSAPGRAFIVGAAGEIASMADTKIAWANHAASKGNAPLSRANFVRAWDNLMGGRTPANSGAFADRQDAIAVATAVLNSAAGRAELAKLDSGAERRVAIASPVPPQVYGGQRVQMYLSEAANDLPRLVPVASVLVLVDLLAPGQIHVQTYYPIA